MEDLFRGRPMDIPAMMARLTKTAKDLGLPFGDRKMTYNSRLAQELGKWAEAKGLGEAFHHAVFRAYFADGKNIGKRHVLADLAGTLGLSTDEALKVLKEGRYKQDVDEDWNRSREMGIQAVPTFHLNGDVLVGAQPYSVLQGFLISKGVGKRAS